MLTNVARVYFPSFLLELCDCIFRLATWRSLNHLIIRRSFSIYKLELEKQRSGKKALTNLISATTAPSRMEAQENYERNSCGIPPELWLEIFDYAAYCPQHPTVVTNDRLNFDQDPLFYYERELDTRIEDYSDEISESAPLVVPTRRALILVCKAWYSLGIKKLYSSLNLNDDVATASLIATLSYSPSLANLVTTLQVSKSRYGQNISNLLELLNNLRVLDVVLYVAPFNNWTAFLNIPTSVTSFYFEPGPCIISARLLNEILFGLESLVHLRLNFINVTLESWPGQELAVVKFPSVRSFGLVLGSSSHHTLLSLLRSWAFGSLEMLILEEKRGLKFDARTFVQRVRSNLITLSFDMESLLSAARPSPILRIPSLQHLHIEAAGESTDSGKEAIKRLESVISLWYISILSLTVPSSSFTRTERFCQLVVGDLFDLLIDRSKLPNLLSVYTNIATWGPSLREEFLSWGESWSTRFEEVGITLYWPNFAFPEDFFQAGHPSNRFHLFQAHGEWNGRHCATRADDLVLQLTQYSGMIRRELRSN